MLYRLIREAINLAVRLFYVVEVRGTLKGVEGPLIVVGNHPNGLIDPALLFALVERRVTFLAKAPLFSMVGIGHVLRALGALPVYRRQDDPSLMGGNEGTFDAAVEALTSGGTITLFPEGKSHSEPGLAELKTGAARIALRALRKGAPVRLVPVGLTYSDKSRFRSSVRVEMGDPLEVVPFFPRVGGDEAECVERLTEHLADRMNQITLNLDAWEDLPLVETAEELYALRTGQSSHDPQRVRQFARGLQILRRRDRPRLARLQAELAAFKRRLEVARVSPGDLVLQYRRAQVTRFVGRNLAALLLGLPLFVLGMGLFTVPYLTVRFISSRFRVAPDVKGTIKLVATLLMAPIWCAFLMAVAWRLRGPGVAIATGLFALPLAVFTRYFLERRAAALRDIGVFFRLGRRATLKAHLLAQADELARKVQELVEEFGSTVVQPGSTGQVAS